MYRKAKIHHVFPTASPDYVVKAWVSHDTASKSYRLTVVPVELRRYSDGGVMELVKVFSGYTVFVEDAPRFSAKRLEALTADAKLLDRVCEMAVRLGGIIEV